MEIKEFIEKFAEEVEIENTETLNEKTKFRELEEWSSLSVMLAIAFFDENFGKEVNNTDISNCDTFEDLYKLAIK